jgi:hypothetical protein
LPPRITYCLAFYLRRDPQQPAASERAVITDVFIAEI